MAISSNRTSNAHVSASSDNDRPKSGESSKKDMWSIMLDSVASGKRLPERNILVLGGSSDSQKEFLDSLSLDGPAKRTQDRHGIRQPPLANNFALGYTYYDVLDADHEDILARLSLYLLAEPSLSFTQLLKPLLTPQTIPNTLIVILLDWSQPWLWLRQLRDWVQLLRTLLVSLDDSCKEKMEEVMISWRDRARGTASLDLGGGNAAAEGEITLPLGPGEWDEALGLPLCVVCQNSDQMETHERERGWREEEFDFVLQFLRTILLKHGASLIYTIPSVPSPLQTLIHSSLGVQSLLKKQALKHNVIDRDKVVLPPNWDSWGKIRVLREGFDVERVNLGWSADIEEFPSPIKNHDTLESNIDADDQVITLPFRAKGGAVELYEETIHDPGVGILSNPSSRANIQKLDVESLDAQAFLASQLEALDRIRVGGEQIDSDSKRDMFGHSKSQSGADVNEENRTFGEGRVNEHIGPVQFNMGGIQVDADDMLQRLKDRQSHQSLGAETSSLAPSDGKSQNEALASFFAGLIERGGATSAGSPKPGVP